ncbi:hypothetical protein AS161_00990 [Fervidobacterium sp. 2310opik-2]|nr:hypothetical protein AS161_00990 [Fervidobacterium sp. 2310opik-2]PHJ13725.1 hypothetical protein IM41_04670 [Fervidobacterium sp. SC_NGM5_G05]
MVNLVQRGQDRLSVRLNEAKNIQNNRILTNQRKNVFREDFLLSLNCFSTLSLANNSFIYFKAGPSFMKVLLLF